MRCSPLLLILALWIVGADALAEAPPRLILATEENPPANFTDPETGRFVGVAHEKVVHLMQRAGLDYEVRVLPWTDAFGLAQTDPRACVYLTNITEERRPGFQWVAPLTEGGWVLFARADWTGKVETPEDLRGLRITVQQSSGIEAHLRKLSEQIGGLDLDTQAGFGNLGRLARGEVDLYAAGIWTGAYHARKERVPVRMVYRLRSSTGGLACNKEMDRDLVARMQAALDSVIADGTADRIDRRYGRPAGWSRGLGD